MDSSLSDNVRRLGSDERFRFRCGPEVPCFTECCRQLDLALTPYDVARLRKGLGITSDEFLEKYAIVEQEENSAFPHVFLTMIDDGRASCPFVSGEGCSVYADRPGACRTYPLGRGATMDCSGRTADLYVLLTEPHCKGFAAGPELTIAEWLSDQGLDSYNEMNDLVMTVLQHQMIRKGFRPDIKQVQRYLNVLYDLDAFRRELNGIPELTDKTTGSDDLDDRQLLRLAVRLVKQELFNE